MYGLEAISAYNGWSMAIVGPLIVMSGLAILAFLISQLHRVVAILERHEEKRKQAKALAAQTEAEDRLKLIVPDRLPSDISETAMIYQPMIDQLEHPFQLKDFYEIAQKNNFPHPYLTATSFRAAGILVNAGEGLFTWTQPPPEERVA
ncbi:MAG: OadG family protein [Deltaproteobacteria bacterium]|nr:OadG family protein [Deltaproteobacteria bacterium]